MYTGLTAEPLLRVIADHGDAGDGVDAALELAWRLRIRDRERSAALVRRAVRASKDAGARAAVFALRSRPPTRATEVLDLAARPDLDPLWSLRALVVGSDRLLDSLAPRQVEALVDATRERVGRARGLAGPGDLQAVENMLGRVCMMSTALRADAVAHYERAAVLSRLAGEDAAEAINLVNAASVLGLLRDPAGALERYLKALEIRERGEVQPRVLSFIHGNVAILYWRMGSLDDALAHAVEAVEVGRRAEPRTLLLHALASCARIRLTRGELGDAERDLVELSNLAETDGGSGHGQVAATLLALTCLLSGQPGRALEILDDAAPVEHDDGVLERGRVRVRALCALKRRDEALAVVEARPDLILGVDDPLHEAVVDLHVANLRAAGREGDAVDLLLQRVHRLQQAPRQAGRTRMAALARDVELRTARARADDASAHARDLQRRLQRAQRLESFGQLAAGLAHDFNNTLTVVATTADTLADEPDADARREAVQALHRAVEQASTVTRRLLTIARKSEVHLARIDLAAHLRDLRGVLQAGVGSHRLVLETDVPAVARVDADLLDQALLNLVINARDAMVEPGVVTVAVHHGAHRVRLSVSDTGTGIASADLERIFDPFFSTKGDAGTGLGLAMVWGIVQQLGGDVSVESAVGSGTTFTLDLPAVQERPT